jgi:hypothetical protein
MIIALMFIAGGFVVAALQTFFVPRCYAKSLEIIRGQNAAKMAHLKELNVLARKTLDSVIILRNDECFSHTIFRHGATEIDIDKYIDEERREIEKVKDFIAQCRVYNSRGTIGVFSVYYSLGKYNWIKLSRIRSGQIKQVETACKKAKKKYATVKHFKEALARVKAGHVRVHK